MTKISDSQVFAWSCECPYEYGPHYLVLLEGQYFQMFLQSSRTSVNGPVPDSIGQSWRLSKFCKPSSLQEILTTVDTLKAAGEANPLIARLRGLA